MATDLRFTIEIDGIQKTITSISEANKVIRDLTKNFVLTKESGQDLTDVVNQLNKALEVKQNLKMVSLGAVELKNNMSGAQTASANASMALMNLNYVIRDSPYFFNNFALGILAVGNNLNPLIDSFNRLRTEAMGKNITTMALLRQAMVGGAGISIAFSIVVTAIQSFVFWMSKSKSEAEGLSDAFDSILSKMIKISETGNQFGISPDQLSSKISAIDTARSMYESKVERITGSPMTKGTQMNEYFVNLFASRKLSDEEERRLEAYQKILEKLREMKEEVLAEYEIAKILNEAKVDQITKEEKIKKLKEDQLKAVQSNASIEDRMANAPKSFAKRGFFAGVETNKRWGMRQAENTKAFGFGGMVKELDTTLEMAKIGAQQLGSVLEDAFSGAKIKLNDLINSIVIAISKMLILQGITQLFSGGMFGGAASSSPASPSSLFKSSAYKFSGSTTNINVNVNGKLRANGKEFVGEFKSMEKQVDKMRL